MHELSSEKPAPEVIEEEPPPPPPEPAEEPPPPEEPPEPKDFEYEHAWDEDYEEHIDAEEPPKPKPKKKKRRYGLVIVVVVILIILILWTVFSPRILPESDGVYNQYHDILGTYVGERDIWAGKMTWGVAIRGNASASVGETFTLTVVLTKISEKSGNWFFKGTAVELRNVSFYDQNDNFMGRMSNWTDSPVGPVATVPLKIDTSGSFYLYLHMRFLVTMDMRIGFLPLETVQIPQAYLDVPIVVS